MGYQPVNLLLRAGTRSAVRHIKVPSAVRQAEVIYRVYFLPIALDQDSEEERLRIGKRIEK